MIRIGGGGGNTPPPQVSPLAISIQAYNYLHETATFDIRMSFLDNSGTKSNMTERAPKIERRSSVYSKQ
jgi:hypothetical protein